jgi:hypothetical protein
MRLSLPVLEGDTEATHPICRLTWGVRKLHGVSIAAALTREIVISARMASPTERPTFAPVYNQLSSIRRYGRWAARPGRGLNGVWKMAYRTLLTFATLRRTFVWLSLRQRRAQPSDGGDKEPDNMSRFETFDLTNYGLAAGRKVSFVRADVPTIVSPFALIHYQLDGKEQPFGLRLDLHKKAFMDLPPGFEPTPETRKAAGDITDILSGIIRCRTH